MSDDIPRGAGGSRVRQALVTACLLLPAIALLGWFAWQWHAGAGVRSSADAGASGGAATRGSAAGTHAGGGAQAEAHDHEDAYLSLRPEMRRAVAERMAGTGEAGEGVEVDLGPRGTMTRLPPAHHPVTVGRVVNGQLVVGEVMHLPEGVPATSADKVSNAAANGAAGR